MPSEHQNISDFIFKINFDQLFANVDLYKALIVFEIGALDIFGKFIATKIMLSDCYFVTIPAMRKELIEQINNIMQFHKFLNPYIMRMTVSFV